MKIGDPVASTRPRGTDKQALSNSPTSRHEVWFEERRVEDLEFDYPRKAFEKVAAVSQWNESIYRNWLSPWIKASSNPVSLFMQKWGHPMRMKRYLFSPQITPAMAWIQMAAAIAGKLRQPVSDTNPWLAQEQAMNKAIVGSLDQWREKRDAAQQDLFTMLYGQS